MGLSGLCCLPPSPLSPVPLPLLCLAPALCPGTHSQHLCSAGSCADTIPPATSGAERGVKTLFHLPLTLFLRTLQSCCCLTALTLSHLAAAQMTPSNSALSCVMNKSLFCHGLCCTFSLNSQNQHTFPIQISTKNSFVTSSK